MRALWSRPGFGELQMRGIRRTWTPERCAEQSRHQHEMRMGWCPPSWRPTYFALRAKKLPAAEAREIVEREIAHAEGKARKAAAAIMDGMIERRARERAEAY